MTAPTPRLTDEQAHSIYQQINFRDDEWTPEASAAVEAIVAEHVAAVTVQLDKKFWQATTNVYVSLAESGAETAKAVARADTAEAEAARLRDEVERAHAARDQAIALADDMRALVERAKRSVHGRLALADDLRALLSGVSQ